MAIITLRSVKGSPLTIAEADANIANLNTELSAKLDITSYTASDVLAKLLTVDGVGSGLDADKLQGRSAVSVNTANSLVLRDSSGNFSAGTITANLTGNVTGNIVGNGTGNWTGPATSVSGIVTVEHGGTGASTIEGAKTALGIGNLAAQNSNSVSITGGTISGITALALADGGTGGTSAATARVNLGVNIGTDVQAFAPILSSISAVTGNGLLAKTGTSTSAARTITAGSNISVVSGDGVSGNPTISLISSPALSGTPTAPTAAPGTANDQIATTGFAAYAVLTASVAQQTYTDNAFNNVAGTAKAWVIFDGNSGTIVASKNVSSVTSYGNGLYSVNLPPGIFANANFMALAMAGGGGGTSGRFVTYSSSSATSLVIYTLLPGYFSTQASLNPGQVRVAMFN